MADADLDVVIRQLAKQQSRALLAAAKDRRDRFVALAVKAKSQDIRDKYRQIARNTMLHGTAAARRLRMSADNAADSYTRSMRHALAQPAKKAAKQTKPG
jgi:hypothetical protein